MHPAGPGIDSLSSHPASHLLHGRGRIRGSGLDRVAFVRTGQTNFAVFTRQRSRVRAPHRPPKSMFRGACRRTAFRVASSGIPSVARTYPESAVRAERSITAWTSRIEATVLSGQRMTAPLRAERVEGTVCIDVAQTCCRTGGSRSGTGCCEPFGQLVFAQTGRFCRRPTPRLP